MTVSAQTADYIITIAQVVFLLMLVPAIVSKTDKPPSITSFGTAISLCAMAYALVSLHAFLGATLTSANAIAWFVLGFQKVLSTNRLHIKK